MSTTPKIRDGQEKAKAREGWVQTQPTKNPTLLSATVYYKSNPLSERR